MNQTMDEMIRKAFRVGRVLATASAPAVVRFDLPNGEFVLFAVHNPEDAIEGDDTPTGPRPGDLVRIAYAYNDEQPEFGIEQYDRAVALNVLGGIVAAVLREIPHSYGAVTPPDLALRGVRLGYLATIDQGAQIGHGVQVGDRAHIDAGAQIGPGVRVGYKAYIGSGVTVGAYAIVESGAYLKPGCQIGAGARVGDGASVRVGVIVPPGSVVADESEFEGDE